MTVKIKDEYLYDSYLDIRDRSKKRHFLSTLAEDRLWDKCDRAKQLLSLISINNSIPEVKKVVCAILDGEKVELEPKYNLVVFEDSRDLYCAFYKRKNENELDISVIVEKFDLKDKKEYHFTQEEIDRYNKIDNVYMDLNTIKVPVEEINE